MNFGKDFVTALKERYHGNSLELAGGEDNEELTIQSKVVEVVGLKKIVERQRCVCVCVCAYVHK